MGVSDRPEMADWADLIELNTNVAIEVCLLGEVVRYHKGPPPQVDVQFGARAFLRDGRRYDRPLVKRVPIAFASFGPIVIRAVPEVGDGVMCHVFDREILTWLMGKNKKGRKGPYDPSVSRMHDSNDIVAVPTLRPHHREPRTTDKARTIYIGHESGEGDYLRIDVQTGKTEIVAKTSLKLGSSSATKGVARMGDSVGIATGAAAWFTQISTFVAAIPKPLTPAELITFATALTTLQTQLGTITGASTKVKSE